VNRRKYSSIQQYLAVAVLLISGRALAQSAGGSTPTLHIGLFGNVDYLTKSEEEGKKSGFRNGTLDLYLTGQISDHWSGVVELNFEHIGTDLERYQLNYEYSDAFRLAIGRVHNPLVRFRTETNPATTKSGRWCVWRQSDFKNSIRSFFSCSVRPRRRCWS
jgi:hypothetical protein